MLFEKPLGVLRQFDKAHTIFEVRLVCALVEFDVAKALILLGSPISGHIFEEGGIDSAVELIDVGGVNAILEPVVFGAQPFNSSYMFAPFVGMTDMKRVT